MTAGQADEEVGYGYRRSPYVIEAGNKPIAGQISDLQKKQLRGVESTKKINHPKVGTSTHKTDHSYVSKDLSTLESKNVDKIQAKLLK